MKIKAKGRKIEALKVTEGQGEVNGASRPTIAIAVKGGLTDEDIKALACGIIDIDDGYKTYKGFTGIVDLELLLYRPSDADLVLDQTADLQKSLDAAKAELEAAKAQLLTAKQQLAAEEEWRLMTMQQLEREKSAAIKEAKKTVLTAVEPEQSIKGGVAVPGQ